MEILLLSRKEWNKKLENLHAQAQYALFPIPLSQIRCCLIPQEHQVYGIHILIHLCCVFYLTSAGAAPLVMLWSESQMLVYIILGMLYYIFFVVSWHDYLLVLQVSALFSLLAVLSRCCCERMVQKTVYMFSFLHMASFTMKIHCFQRNFSFSSSALVPVQLPSRMETHFWYILPDEVKSATLLNQYLDILSPCEKENVLRMHGDHLKKSALLARALVRTTIAR